MVLLRPFVKTTKGMEGNVDSEGLERSREALYESFISTAGIK